MGRMGISAFSRRLLGVLALGALVGCGDEPAEEPSEFIAVRRAWRPGERDSLINAIITNRTFAGIPFVGDLSDMAPQFYADPDSTVEFIRNPAFSPSLTSPINASVVSQAFSTTWNFVALKITSINDSQYTIDSTLLPPDTILLPPDTLFWHATIWTNPANIQERGIVIAFNRTSNFNTGSIDTDAFDLSGGKVGAAGLELHQNTGTLWADDRSGGRYAVTGYTWVGTPDTIRSGPYLGGLTRSGTQFGRIQTARFVRVSGTENPNNFNVSFDWRTTGMPAVEIFCKFSYPCTTDDLTPAIMRASRSSR